MMVVRPFVRRGNRFSTIRTFLGHHQEAYIKDVISCLSAIPTYDTCDYQLGLLVTAYNLSTDEMMSSTNVGVMVNLDESDLAVLSLLAERPLPAPPPLVLEIIQELRPSGLTVFADGCWQATPLGLEVLSNRKKVRSG